MSKITLKKGEGRTISSGGLWVYDNEIDRVEGDYVNGDIVEVVSYKDDFLGRGYINDNSKIRVRLLTRDKDEAVDEDLLRRRLSDAWNYRKQVVETDSCRVVFSDSDRLPGLIVDKYEDVLVFEFDTLGMDVRKDIIVRNMFEVLKEDDVIIKGAYERSDSRVRLLEGLERVKGFLTEPFDTGILINENGVRLKVNVAEGQKTGCFLDQKYNHLAIRRICKDKKVLDCFTHTGGFALSAATVCKNVLGIDASELAVEQAKENSELNGFTNTEFIVDDVFDYLDSCEEKYDVIILDPPAFTKSKNSVRNAAKGYREINLKAMKLLNPQGFLVTCSCSEYIDRDHFLSIIQSCANDAHKRLRLIENRIQSPDHPVVIGNNISDYLKCMIFQVNDR
ncbi:MAG: class I SAM-dependent rRNA methyltransferase [Erysipelotrichaceae bacterium]|nr:class I SAM-dependent rRNA methyltransferase [Erysipelotrichaceae bacterium]